MERVDVAVIGSGQSGLAAAHALRRHGLAPVVLESSDRPAGSWPRYYESLRLFSPARYSSLPGMPFDGDLDRYPHRDEVVAYLLRYADRLDADIRTRTRVLEVSYGDGAFGLSLEDGSQLEACAVVAATGTFGRPHRPDLPGLEGLEGYAGAVLHAADYRTPEPFTGQRVVVVGAGNSAVQIAAEVAERAQVTLAARHPLRFARQRTLGRDLHWWLARSGLDTLPIGRFLRTPPTQLVIGDGRYRVAVAAGQPDRRPLFTGISATKAIWADGATEEVDTVLLATGYRPDLGYLAPLGALDASGHPRHREGVSLTHPGLVYVGLEWQRSLSSNSLRGVGRDAVRTARHVAAHLAHFGEAGLGPGRADWGPDAVRRRPRGRSRDEEPAAHDRARRAGCHTAATPSLTGSTCVNIDACRIRRCCRCWSPRSPRPWPRAALRSPNGR